MGDQSNHFDVSLMPKCDILQNWYQYAVQKGYRR